METSTNVLDAVLEVFEQISAWMVTAFDNITPMFYGADGLTFLGVLAVAGLAISVILMVIGIIQNFLHFRG